MTNIKFFEKKIELPKWFILCYVILILLIKINPLDKRKCERKVETINQHGFDTFQYFEINQSKMNTNEIKEKRNILLMKNFGFSNLIRSFKR